MATFHSRLLGAHMLLGHQQTCGNIGTLSTLSTFSLLSQLFVLISYNTLHIALGKGLRLPLVIASL